MLLASGATRARRRVRFGLFLLLIASPLPGAFAQPVPGDTVRLTGERERWSGVLVDATGAAFQLAPLAGGEPLVIGRDSVRTLEVLTGRERRVLAHLGLGAVAGLLGGVVAGTLTPVHRGSPFGRGGEMVGGGVVGMLAGGVLGAISGSRRSARWVEADARTLSPGDTIRLRLRGRARGAGVIEGPLALLARDTILVRDRLSNAIPIAMSDVVSAEVNRGTKRAGGSAIGGTVAAGILAFGGIGMLAGGPGGAVLGSVAGATLGTMLGGLAAIAPGVRWIPFNPATARRVTPQVAPADSMSLAGVAR